MSENRNLIRSKNLERLKIFLFNKKEALKAEMAKETTISVVTINSLVKQLVEENIFIEGDSIQQSLGRPAIKYSFNYDKTHYLLLSIQEKQSSNTKEKALYVVGKIVNLAGDEKYAATIDFPKVDISELCSIVNQFLQRGIPIDKIGLSFPGKIYQGTVVSSWLSLFDGWEFEKQLKEITDIPLAVQNDAHLITMGFSLQKNLISEKTIVGIFYPANSMPGITICSHGTILEGSRGLAGEAKFLPTLIHSGSPKTEHELIENLTEIISIYNAVIAPDIFVVSAESVSQESAVDALDHSTLLDQQLNKPSIQFVDNFQNAMTYGLRWLVSLDTIYRLE